MGQKVHPTGFRLAVSRAWESKWYASPPRFAQVLIEDIRIRRFLMSKKKLQDAGVCKIIIERPRASAKITLHASRPGMIIGKKGEDIEKLKKEVQALLGVPLSLDVQEIRKPDAEAQLVAVSVAQQLERRIQFRRAMKRAVANTMRLGAQGIKIQVSGRLGGAEIARTEWYREGRVPLHTLRADVDYGFTEAKTTYGVIGVKVWICRGDLPQQSQAIKV